MGFISNLIEDFEGFLLRKIAEGRMPAIERRETELLELKSSINYRRTDLTYLVQKGFTYSKIGDVWSKEEYIKHGKYPGRYRITIQFPDEYPARPADIRVYPKDKNRIYSNHISSGSGKVCVANRKHGSANSYWKSHMNVKGALQLVYHLITDEINQKYKTKERKKVSLKGTIFEDLKKVVTKKELIKEFMKPKNIKVYETWKWEEIAYKVSKLSRTTKTDLVKYYNRKLKVQTYKKAMKNLEKISKKKKKRSRSGTQKKEIIKTRKGGVRSVYTANTGASTNTGRRTRRGRGR